MAYAEQQLTNKISY